jgi:hypothetical protein
MHLQVSTLEWHFIISVATVHNTSYISLVINVQCERCNIIQSIPCGQPENDSRRNGSVTVHRGYRSINGFPEPKKRKGVNIVAIQGKDDDSFKKAE